MPTGQQLHPATEQVFRYFEYEHLPPQLQVISEPFHALAQKLVSIPGLNGPELTVGLRKLLEAKDCAVRAALAPRPDGPPPPGSTPARPA